MDQPGIPQLQEAVRASFEPIMKALGPARQQLAGVKDVVTTRPGYKYPPAGAPVPAIVVAVTPGTTPVQAADLEKTLEVPFAVIDATVEEQLAADKKQPVSFGTPDGSMVSAFEKMLGGDELLDFLPVLMSSRSRLSAGRSIEPPDRPPSSYMSASATHPA